MPSAGTLYLKKEYPWLKTENAFAVSSGAINPYNLYPSHTYPKTKLVNVQAHVVPVYHVTHVQSPPEKKKRVNPYR
jgi:hypothetical protein